MHKTKKQKTCYNKTPNKACTRRWGVWRNLKHFSTPYHFSSWTASPSPAPARVTQTVETVKIQTNQ